MELRPLPSFGHCLCGLPTRWHQDDGGQAIGCDELRPLVAAMLADAPAPIAEQLTRIVASPAREFHVVPTRPFDAADRSTWPQTLTPRQLAAAIGKSLSWLRHFRQQSHRYPVAGLDDQPHAFARSTVIAYLDRATQPDVRFLGSARRQRARAAHAG